MRKIKQNDEIIVLAGKDKGRKARVLKVIMSGKKVIVEGVNMVKKHMKPIPQKEQRGGIIDKESPIDISNVALLNPSTQKADRVGFKTIDGMKRRYFKSNGELVDI